MLFSPNRIISRLLTGYIISICDAVGVRIDRTPVDQELIANELWERENKK